MPKGKATTRKRARPTETRSIEAKLWEAANALRGSMDAAGYKHVVLGLIFLKYISDAFEAHREKLQSEPYANPEDPDEYRADNIFWVPPEARWSHLQKNARQPNIAELVDQAMGAIERDNPSLKGVLPKEYARLPLDPSRLGQLIDLFSNIRIGGDDNHAHDILGRVYEYFLGQFASAEGKKGGEFYTPRSVVKLLVEMLQPYCGRVYDPCCGSAGMFIQSEAFLRAHGGRIGDISIYGQELNHTTRGEQLGLSDEELAFYDALQASASAVEVLGEPTLKQIAHEIVQTVRQNVTVDWTRRETAKAHLRRLVKRILRKHGYPPDKYEQVADTVLQQAQLFADEWAAA
jgi:type I restriction enzyme M protein